MASGVNNLAESMYNVILKLLSPIKYHLKDLCGYYHWEYSFCSLFSCSRVSTECFVSPASFNSTF